MTDLIFLLVIGVLLMIAPILLGITQTNPGKQS